jgi:hypothetical protein
MDVYIDNSRVDADSFKFEIQVKRTDMWSTVFPGIGNCDFYFHNNSLAFTGEPFLCDTNMSIMNFPENYNFSVQFTGGRVQVKLSWIQMPPFLAWNPPLGVIEKLCTVVWEIADPTENSEIIWDELNSGFNDVEGDIITPTFLGNGNMTLSTLPVVFSADIPESYKLHQNYPNPFNPSTRIRFDIPRVKEGQLEASLVIYNSLGQLVRRLYSGEIGAGRFEVEWNGRSDSGNPIPSGIYFIIFKAGYYSEIKRVILLK